MSKPSVNAPNTSWVLRDTGRPSYNYRGDKIKMYQQRDMFTGDWIEHYRFSVNSKWNRKTFYGETAWSDSERYVLDTYGVDITA
jgi:hypothetical protein